MQLSSAWCHIWVMAVSACAVERPLRAPNCLESSLSTIFGNSLRPISDSSSLLNVAVSEMGRRSSQMDCGGFVFGIGITFALFQISGTDPLLKDAFKMWHTGSAMAKANSFRNQFGISFGPGDLCNGFSHVTINCTSLPTGKYIHYVIHSSCIQRWNILCLWNDSLRIHHKLMVQRV